MRPHLPRFHSRPSTCTAVAVPRERMRGTNGALAALNTKAASWRLPMARWIADSAVWLSVSIDLVLSAGRCTSVMPRWVRGRARFAERQ